jgi:hypothetical protein
MVIEVTVREGSLERTADLSDKDFERYAMSVQQTLLDGERCDEPFQHIFCLWSLSSSESNADSTKAFETRAFDPKNFQTRT